MRLHRLVASKRRGEFLVKADVSGQGKRSVRVSVGNLSDRQLLAQRIVAIRAARTLKEAFAVSGGM